MCDYATVYEKKKYAINTKYRDSSLQYFPKQSRQHLIIQAELLKKRTRNHYNDYLLFSPLFLFLTQIEPFCHHFSCLSSKKDREEKRWLAISAISDLKLAKRKYFTAESGVLL
jgi:hypothetical protein